MLLKFSKDSAIGPSPNNEVSRVTTVTLPNSSLSYHCWMNRQISSAIETLYFQNVEPPRLRDTMYTRDVHRTSGVEMMGCCVVWHVLGLS